MDCVSIVENPPSIQELISIERDECGVFHYDFTLLKLYFSLQPHLHSRGLPSGLLQKSGLLSPNGDIRYFDRGEDVWRRMEDSQQLEAYRLHICKVVAEFSAV